MLNKIKVTDLQENIVDLFKNQAAICVSGDESNHNGLSIAWGCLGSLWKKEVAIVYVKPTRYSFEFIEKYDYFSIMWFDDPLHSDIIKNYGTLSGRDVNKEELCNLNKVIIDNCVCYNEARLIITCRKIYSNKIDKNLILSDDVLSLNVYKDNIFHSEYIGEIIGVYTK